jgi:hypothetical protein
MTREQEDVSNPFLNPIRALQNYWIYWIEVNRYFYESAIRTDEQWFKAFWDPWLKAGTSQRKTIKVE